MDVAQRLKGERGMRELNGVNSQRGNITLSLIEQSLVADIITINQNIGIGVTVVISPDKITIHVQLLSLLIAASNLFQG